MKNYFNLGGLNAPIDTRDLELGKASPMVDIPKAFMQNKAWNLPIFDQNQQPACSAHSAAWAKMLLDSYDEPAEYSPRFSWVDIKKNDKIPVSDGSNIREIMKTLSKTGAYSLSKMPNDTNISLEEYLNIEITPGMMEEAYPNVISTYAFETNPTWDNLRQAIYKHKAIVARIEVGETWWKDKYGISTYSADRILPLRPPEKIISGHFVVFHSYDEKNLYFANSFGKLWADRGHGRVGKNYMKYITTFATAVDIPNKEVREMLLKKSLLERLATLYKQLLSLTKKYHA